jgi:hypothetical protein
VIQHVVGGEQRQPGLPGDRGEAGEASRIVAAIEMLCREIGAAAEIGRDASRK